MRRPRVHPSMQRGMDCGELASFLYTAERASPTHAVLAVLLGLNGLPVSEACAATMTIPGSNGAILRIGGKGNKPAASHWSDTGARSRRRHASATAG